MKKCVYCTFIYLSLSLFFFFWGGGGEGEFRGTPMYAFLQVAVIMHQSCSSLGLFFSGEMAFAGEIIHLNNSNCYFLWEFGLLYQPQGEVYCCTIAGSIVVVTSSVGPLEGPVPSQGRVDVVGWDLGGILQSSSVANSCNLEEKVGTTLVWVPLIIEHLNAITDCKFGRHDTEHYNK